MRSTVPPVLPAKATALAVYLAGQPVHSGIIEIHEPSAAESIGMQEDTLYRALTDLARVGAVRNWGRRGHKTHDRQIIIDPTHWVWVMAADAHRPHLEAVGGAR